MKWCPSCSTPRLFAAFYATPGRGDGYGGRCRACESAIGKDKRAATAAQVRAFRAESLTKRDAEGDADALARRASFLAAKEDLSTVDRTQPPDISKNDPRQCVDCLLVYPLVEFSFRSGGRCVPCAKVRALARQRLRKYGLDGNAYAAMLTTQGGLCAICRADAATSVDHCHASGLVRAVLCGRCNTMLGMGRDNPSILRAAADYLEKHTSDEKPQ